MFGEMIKIRQKFCDNKLNDIKSTVGSELDKLDLRIARGSRIAITAGSRGIDSIPLILKTVADKIKFLGGDPFIVPAMGSHGGATAEGQVNMLKELGITPEYLGIPVMSSMDVFEIGRIPCEGGEELPVYMDKYAYGADGIIVVNRIKPHTSFHAEIESGMMKMMAIGLGKAVQAQKIHSFGTRGLREYIVPAARKILGTGKIIAGIGVIENAYDQIMEIRAFLPDEIESNEKALLVKAGSLMPRLPVEQLDVLVVDRIGKNISGTGMDTNIIGRLKIKGEAEPEKPNIKSIVALDLTEETRGNAYGIGLADFTTKALVDKIDYNATYANALTTGFVERVKIPVIAGSAEEAVGFALRMCNINDFNTARVIKIRNTLDIEEMWVSKPVYEELKNREGIDIKV